MTLAGIPEAFSRAQAYRESLMRLGFTDDQIKLGFGVQVLNYETPPADRDTVTVHLYATDGAPSVGDFVVACGHAPFSWTRAKDRLIDAWNALTREQREQLYEQYQPWPMIYHLAEALVAKGIEVPGVEAVRVRGVGDLPPLVPKPPPGNAN